MKVGFVSISDARDIKLYAGTSKFIVEGLEKYGAEIIPLFPLDRSFRYLYLTNKAFASVTGRGFAVDRQPFALRRYATQIEDALSRTSVDLLFSNSSVPLTQVRSNVPKLFWTDAVWHDMRNYYPGLFWNPTSSTDTNALRQEELALNNVDAAVYTSHWAAATAGRLSSPSKISVIPRGANLPIKHGISEVQKWALRRAEARCTLLFIGADWERKGGITALQTASELNAMGTPTDLVVVGCQPRGPLKPFVKVIGYVDKNTRTGYGALTACLQESTFLILPTTAEAGGIVFSEASAFGVPSLAYATGGVGEYVRNGVNGYTFSVGTPPSVIALTVRNLRQDKARYIALALASFEEHRARLNWDCSIEKLIGLMDAVRRGRPSPRYSETGFFGKSTLES